MIVKRGLDPKFSPKIQGSEEEFQEYNTGRGDQPRQESERVADPEGAVDRP